MWDSVGEATTGLHKNTPATYVHPEVECLVGKSRPVMFVLPGAVTLVLLIAFVNALDTHCFFSGHLSTLSVGVHNCRTSFATHVG